MDLVVPNNFQHLRTHGSIPPPSDASESAQCTRARLRSCSTFFSSIPFTTLPTRFNHVRVHPALWLTMVDIRLGQPLYSDTTYCPQCATRPGPTPLLDPLGRHALMCRVAEGTTRRHNTLRDTVISIVSRPPLCQPSRPEVTLPRFLYTHLPKRVDILVASTPDFHPAPLALDVTIRCPYARHVLSSAALTSSTVPNRGEQQKSAIIGPTATRKDGTFTLPLSIRLQPPAPRPEDF